MLKLGEMIRSRWGENYELQERYINPAFAKVLRIIGFDRLYAKGEGAYLYDEEGRQYLDFICGYGVFNLGRNHPAVHAVLKEYLDLSYPNLVKMDAPLLAGLLAEALVKRMPPGLEQVFFATSGAEGMEAALKFCRAASPKRKVVFAEHAFHGLTFAALSLNGDDHFREQFEPLMQGTVRVPFNDCDALERVLSEGDVMAFVVEPIQGKGLFVPGDDYLKEAGRLCRKHGAFLVVDEVQTGMGRTGKFLALEHFGVEPDIVVISKSLSGGEVPISAVIGRKAIFAKVFDRLDRCVVHSSTFSQNGMASAAGLAALNVLDEDGLIENAARMGELLKSELAARKQRFELLHDVRGKGLMIGVEFGPPRSLGLKMAWKLLHKADAGLFSQAVIIPLLEKHRILTQVSGHNMDVIKLAPALCVNEADIRRFLAAFDSVMEDCHRFPGPVWEVGTNLAKFALRGTSRSGAHSGAQG